MSELQELRTTLADATRSRMPPGYRAEDHFPGAESDGFILAEEAADAMAITVTDLVALVRTGVLAARMSGGVLYVRPAVATVRAVAVVTTAGPSSTLERRSRRQRG